MAADYDAQRSPVASLYTSTSLFEDGALSKLQYIADTMQIPNATGPVICQTSTRTSICKGAIVSGWSGAVLANWHARLVERAVSFIGRLFQVLGSNHVLYADMLVRRWFVCHSCRLRWSIGAHARLAGSKLYNIYWRPWPTGKASGTSLGLLELLVMTDSYRKTRSELEAAVP